MISQVKNYLFNKKINNVFFITELGGIIVCDFLEADTIILNRPGLGLIVTITVYKY